MRQRERTETVKWIWEKEGEREKRREKKGEEETWRGSDTGTDE